MHLDTCGEVNLMAHHVAKDLGLVLEPCDTTIRGIGSEPTGTVGKTTAEWYFPGGGVKVYEELFYVIETEEYDALVSGSLIFKNGIMIRNRAVCP